MIDSVKQKKFKSVTRHAAFDVAYITVYFTEVNAKLLSLLLGINSSLHQFMIRPKYV